MRQHSKARVPSRATALIAVVACSFAGGSAAAGTVLRYEGDAYAAGGGRLLYRESHWLYEEDGSAARVVLYRCPDGAPFARKHVRAQAAAQAPDFEMHDARSGYTEGVRSNARGREVFVRAGGGDVERSASLPAASDIVIDAGFDAFVLAHWDALAKGADVPLAFVVPSRFAALRFKVRRIDDAHATAAAAMHLRLQLASWYGALLPHIDVEYAEAGRELRRYEGISNVRDAASNNVHVRIEFPDARRIDASGMQAVDAALAVTLTGTCPLS